MTNIAVPISASNLTDAKTQVEDALKSSADILELRTDYLQDLTTEMLDELLAFTASKNQRVIVTCRDPKQGGQNDYPLDLRIAILARAAAEGADFIDCEYENYCDENAKTLIDQALSDSNTRLILSAHDFSGPFEDLGALYEKMLAANPEAIHKLVFTATHINDCFAAFNLLKNKRSDAIVLAMGPHGLITRILAKKLGAFLTFASLGDASATAPGQITIKTLKSLYRWDNITPETRLFGVIGYPVGHSLSPAIFNACFDKQGIDALYMPILVEGEADQFDAFIENVIEADMDFHGFSVTIPHKAHALDYVERKGDYLEQLAADIGAVNTLKIGFDRIVSGYNTDYAGAMDAIESALAVGKHSLHSVDVAVLGAGGVARALVAGLSDVGASITIYNRTVEKAKSLAEEFKCKYAPLDKARETEAKLIVNCTSIGMHPNVEDSPLPAETIKPGIAVFDTVYNPLKTKLLQYAEQNTAKTINGAEMFIRQAMAQFKIFLQTEADEQQIRKTILNNLKS